MAVQLTKLNNKRAKSPPPETRYNLRLPTLVYEELERVANEQGTNRLELIRKFIKLGLLVVDLEANDNDSGLYFKRDGEFEKIVIL